ncbi:TetR/AcrR family transcriptional regulator [Leucobacter weissii]|uniref:TetR/AcrR family transcriptional regulator n=1 Tax=Leucobacter weissii TaxID=1983706 RepID=A0A939MK44_9MICO|nr:TetR/AcrR family transcriptional regulator [Leucobacter weissii]MBO1902448.1 TetR/AcrR family transcriptional regulator [Leucobacter weissii]
MARAYRSPRREAESAATRSAVIAAAAKLFVRDGYVATSIRAIAEEAGVSVPTVHNQGQKHTLLMAAFEVAFASDEGSHSLADRPHMVEAMSQPDTELAIAQYVRLLGEAHRRAAGLVRAMAAAADADPLVRAAYADIEARGRRDTGIAAGWLVERGLVAPEHLSEAADVFGYIVSADAYVHFTETRGWSLERWEAFTVHQLAHIASAIPAVGAPRG